MPQGLKEKFSCHINVFQYRCLDISFTFILLDQNRNGSSFYTAYLCTKTITCKIYKFYKIYQHYNKYTFSWIRNLKALKLTALGVYFIYWNPALDNFQIERSSNYSYGHRAVSIRYCYSRFHPSIYPI